MLCHIMYIFRILNGLSHYVCFDILEMLRDVMNARDIMNALPYHKLFAINTPCKLFIKAYFCPRDKQN